MTDLEQGKEGSQPGPDNDRRNPHWKFAHLVGCGITVSLSLGLGIADSPAFAQITPDRSLGAESSRVETGQVGGLPATRIGGGAVRAGNLFHSFQQFNVRNGQRVYFDNPAGIQNILGRVTGRGVSNILGTMGVAGSANLYLINPNGIVFGPNARLDVNGSFTASTADRFSFGNGSFFSTLTPQAPPTLTVNVPIGLQYEPGLGRAGRIRSEGILAAGRNLTLDAGFLDLAGQLRADNNLTLQAQSILQANGIQASSTGDMRLQGNAAIHLGSAQPTAPSRLVSGGNLLLLSDGVVTTDAQFSSGGNFAVQRLSGEPGYWISRQNATVNVAGDCAVGDYTGPSLQVNAGGNISYGAVQITALDPRIDPTHPVFALNAGGQIIGKGPISSTTTLPDLVVSLVSQGDTVVREITTRGGPISLISRGGNIISRNSLTSGTILDAEFRVLEEYAGGAIALSAGRNLTAGNLSAFSFSRLVNVGTGGNGGAIALSAGENLRTENLSSYSGSRLGTGGNGGAIALSAGRDLTTGNLFSYSGSRLGTGGNGGAIALSAGRDLTTGDLSSVSVSDLGTGGNGGAIALSAGRDLTTGDLSSGSGNVGNGGAIALSAGRDLTTGNLKSSTVSDSGNAGNGGAIALSAGRNLTTQGLESYSYSYSLYSNAGNGGAIALSAGGNLTTGDLNSSSYSRYRTASNGGAIALSAGGNLTTQGLKSSSSTVSDSGNAGNGGAIALSAGRNLTTQGLDSSSSSSSNSGNVGNGGAITLSAGENLTTGDLYSFLFTGGNEGNGGAIALSAGRNLTTGNLDSSSISEGNAGNGGAIVLSADRNLTAGRLYSYSRSFSNTAGNGGAITLLSSNGVIRIGDLFAFSYSSTGAAGRGGNIRLSAIRGNISNNSRSIVRRDGSQSNISSFAVAGPGRAARQGGTVQIEVQNQLSNLAILTLSSSSNSGAVGISGNQDLAVNNVAIVTSRQLVIQNPVLDKPIRLSIGGQGQSGPVSIQTPGDLTFTNSSIQSDTKGSGRAGDVVIRSGGRTIFDNSRIDNGTNSTGPAGNILIETPRLLLNNSQLNTETRIGDGGNIQLRGLNWTVLQNNSQISAAASERAQGGSISINTPETRGGFIVGFNNSDIIATAQAGQGGRIDIYADGIFKFVLQNQTVLGANAANDIRTVLRNNATNDISASSQAGPQGVVNIQTGVDPTRGNTELPGELIDTSGLVSQQCQPNSNIAQTRSEFFVSGRGGVPATPTDLLDTQPVLDDLGRSVTSPSAGTPSATASTPVETATSPSEIVEAQGWVTNPNGTVALIANATTAAPHGGRSPLTCSAALSH